VLPKLKQLVHLNISSNALTHLPFQGLICSPALKNLRSLDVSNSRLGDKLGQQLLTAVLCNPESSMEHLNLQRNGLGFKTGAFIMSLLVTGPVKQHTKVAEIDLAYNNISLLVQNSIRKLISETAYRMDMQKDTNESMADTEEHKGYHEICKFVTKEIHHLSPE
jgi:Leucine-rich repeat (LRR) protein